MCRRFTLAFCIVVAAMVAVKAFSAEPEQTTWREGDSAWVSILCPQMSQARTLAEMPAVEFWAWTRSPDSAGCRVRQYGQRQIPIIVAGYSSGSYYDGTAYWSVWVAMALDTGELAFVALDDRAGRHKQLTGL